MKSARAVLVVLRLRELICNVLPALPVGFSIIFTAAVSQAAPGDLYVTETPPGIVTKIAPDGTKSTFASDFQIASGMAFDRSGNLLVSDTGTGTIFKFAPDGTQSTFAMGLTAPGAMAFDGMGNLFVAESFGDIANLTKITPSGERSTFASGNYFPRLAFGLSGDLFASTFGPTTEGSAVVYFTPDGVQHGSGAFVGTGLAFDSAGNFFVATTETIVKYTLAPISMETFASGLKDCGALAFDGEGNLFASDYGAGSIYKYAPDGTRTTFATGLKPFFIAIEPMTEKVRNLSARGLVGTGDNALIGGFIVGGNSLANNAVLVRAIGPSLGASGVENPLADPMLELHNESGSLVASNDDWQDSQKDQITATGLPPTNANESAIYATLPTGSYTAVVRGAADQTGVALVEVYSLSQ